MRHYLLIGAAALALTACEPAGEKKADTPKPASETSGPIKPVITTAPSGRYTLDKMHASLLFRVSHLGFSNYTARFKSFDATLDLDTQTPANSKLEVTVDATSLETDFPDPKVVDFNAQLQNAEWLDTATYPTITYRSTAIGLTSPNTAVVTGDFTLHGVTKPLTLNVTFNGGYPGLADLDPNGRVGFSARTVLKRSDFGITTGIPAPGSNIGVGDDVEVIIEAEFSGPPMVAPSSSAEPAGSAPPKP
jgi:polyisoprenoid-binding protein YceI